MNSYDLIGRLISHLGLNEKDVLGLIRRAPFTYKVYTIPKKTGGKRVIAQPARETKYIQNWLIDNVFVALPVHERSMAYKKKIGLMNNVLPHKNNKYLAKFDFKNFFHSIKFLDLVNHFNKYLHHLLSEAEIQYIARVACIKERDSGSLCLSVGAPSSPLLSNSFMFEFDSAIEEWCQKNKIIYTRYADDLTFSTNISGATNKIQQAIIEILSLKYPNLFLNHDKSIQLSNKNRRRVTGLIITNQQRISVGRDRKRMVTSMIHKFSIGELRAEDIFYLQGMLGFIKSVEPNFLVSMNRKYGHDLLTKIISIRKK